MKKDYRTWWRKELEILLDFVGYDEIKKQISSYKTIDFFYSYDEYNLPGKDNCDCILEQIIAIKYGLA